MPVTKYQRLRADSCQSDAALHVATAAGPEAEGLHPLLPNHPLDLPIDSKPCVCDLNCVEVLFGQLGEERTKISCRLNVTHLSGRLKNGLVANITCPWAEGVSPIIAMDTVAKTKEAALLRRVTIFVLFGSRQVKALCLNCGLL